MTSRRAQTGGSHLSSPFSPHGLVRQRQQHHKRPTEILAWKASNEVWWHQGIKPSFIMPKWVGSHLFPQKTTRRHKPPEYYRKIDFLLLISPKLPKCSSGGNSFLKLGKCIGRFVEDPGAICKNIHGHLIWEWAGIQGNFWTSSNSFAWLSFGTSSTSFVCVGFDLVWVFFWIYFLTILAKVLRFLKHIPHEFRISLLYVLTSPLKEYSE